MGAEMYKSIKTMIFTDNVGVQIQKQKCYLMSF